MLYVANACHTKEREYTVSVLNSITVFGTLAVSGKEGAISDLTPFDLTSLFQERLQRPYTPSGELSVSRHLTGSLRHAMLDAAGAPKLPRPLTDSITLNTGDLWHDWMYATIDRLSWPYMKEVKLNPWLPEGWRGRADLVIWHPEHEGFVLGDIKTTKGKSMYWINKAGAKEAHIWQVSAYWHALVKMGLPMVEGIFVYYFPKDGIDNGEVLPAVIEAPIIPVRVMKDEMTYRWERMKEYAASIVPIPEDYPYEVFLTDELEPVQERQQKLVRNAKMGVTDLKLVPDWSAMFCDFPDELCDCNLQRPTKIGHYLQDGTYVPRKGYEDVEPLIKP